ncbi:hypothetical protein ABIB62_002821 [Mucilaginibacter sp. UYP25]|uniref:hypothetical protein n=1 Tax=unclassified Mucilaginibacter TaxID=2617802 RepID=UPI003399945C
MDQQLLKQIRFLKYYSAALTLVVITGFCFAFTTANKKPRFKEIDVERINVVEKSGKLKMVISNDELQHPGIIDGKPLPKRGRSAGIVFFNTDGDECGGLLYDGTKKSAGLVLSVDKYKNDQIMQLQYNDDGSTGKPRTSYGLKLWDRPANFTVGQQMAKYDSLLKTKDKQILEDGLQKMRQQGLLGYGRLFIGKNQQNEVGLFIKDKQGKPRINLYVDDNNRVIMQALNEKGDIVPFK